MNARRLPTAPHVVIAQGTDREIFTVISLCAVGLLLLGASIGAGVMYAITARNAVAAEAAIEAARVKGRMERIAASRAKCLAWDMSKQRVRCEE